MNSLPIIPLPERIIKPSISNIVPADSDTSHVYYLITETPYGFAVLFVKKNIMIIMISSSSYTTGFFLGIDFLIKYNLITTIIFIF
jgi:hypothetical protein